jgi:MFS family permease
MILLGGQAMASMDTSILVVAAPSLRASLHASAAELQLVVATYTVAFAALVVTGARLGDVLGRRRAFMQGLTGFTLASIIGGLAPSPVVLIGARALQGAAAALMTPQVLSIIQVRFEGRQRARAVGAYSMILAVGVAGGQILGGLLVSLHLLQATWRPALLLNAPIGVGLLASARRALPPMARGGGQRLDLAGVCVLAIALVALVMPLSLGREAGWPGWVWPSLALCVIGAGAFVTLERRVKARGNLPLLDLALLRTRGIPAGVIAIALVMSCYAGFVLSLTLRLQDGLGFSALHAGLTFAIYAAGFATASLTSSRAGASVRDRLPVLGPLLMGCALLALGLAAEPGGWRPLLAAPLLFCAGVGHAWGFSPLANRLSSAVEQAHVADLSGLILTASLIGQVVGFTAFVGLYLSIAPHGSARALAATTAALATALVATSVCARAALGQRDQSPQSPAPGFTRGEAVDQNQLDHDITIPTPALGRASVRRTSPHPLRAACTEAERRSRR